MKQALCGFLVVLMVMQPTLAAGASAPSNCSPSLDLSSSERDHFIGFRSRLSHLHRHHGKETFEPKLQEAILKHWPTTKMMEISSTFLERTLNLVDQERLKHSVALTIGLDHKAWTQFERGMRAITVFGSSVGKRLERDAANLMETIAKTDRRHELKIHHGIKLTKEEWALRQVEAIARASTMFTYLVRWQAINKEITIEKGQAASKQMAMYALGLMGAGVLVGTFVVSGPLIAGGGAVGASLSANPALSLLLAKVGEAAAGSLLGIAGAPAVNMMENSYHVLSEAKKQSLNNQSNYLCELNKQIDSWKDRAAEEAISAALFGGALGMGGGLLTFSKTSANIVLWATGFGVGVAQLYVLGQMGHSTMESLAYYRMAEAAHEAGDRKKAIEYLHLSRDAAQASGEKALEAIVIATLSAYISVNFRFALAHGQTAIRQLYANAADTLPLAGVAAVEGAQSALPIGEALGRSK